MLSQLRSAPLAVHVVAVEACHLLFLPMQTCPSWFFASIVLWPRVEKTRALRMCLPCVCVARFCGTHLCDVVRWTLTLLMKRVHLNSRSWHWVKCQLAREDGSFTLRLVFCGARSGCVAYQQVRLNKPRLVWCVHVGFVCFSLGTVLLVCQGRPRSLQTMFHVCPRSRHILKPPLAT